MTIYDCPRMSWQDFLNIPNGETVFNHGASECVALANLYNEGVMGGGFVAVGSALQWWTNGNVSANHGFDRITSNPQVGDIFIASCEIYNCQFGHIGVVVRAWDGSTFGTMEQNVYGEFVSRHDRTMANVDGFLRPQNQSHLAAPAPALAGNQRVAGENGANRRAAPSVSSEILEPHLDAGAIGNFVNFIHAEDPYGNGNDVWFQGISGNWFYSGAFTDQGTHDLNDVTIYAPAPTPVEPTPVDPTPVTPPKEEVVITIETEKEKEITVTKPSVKPENIEHKEDSMSTTSASPVNGLTAEEWIAKQQQLASGIKPADLGAIITHAQTRKVVWAIYGLAGIAIVGFMGGLTAIGAVAPEWFLFATGSYTAVGPAFASLAIANISTKKD